MQAYSRNCIVNAIPCMFGLFNLFKQYYESPVTGRTTLSLSFSMLQIP